MNRDKRGGRVEGVRKRRGGNRQMFSSSPTSSGDPLLFNAGTLRMSGGKTWHGERREGEREARKGKHCWNLCKIRSSWTPRARVLDIQRVFLTRYHPFLFLPFFLVSGIGSRNYLRSDAFRIFDQSPLDGWINGISNGNVFHSVETCYIEIVSVRGSLRLNVS